MSNVVSHVGSQKKKYGTKSEPSEEERRYGKRYGPRALFSKMDNTPEGQQVPP
jgi:hypothetical protein